MPNYSEAIKRPFTDFKKLIIGIILGIIPIVNFLVMGYILECAKTANKKKFELPKWKNFGELWVSGFFIILISIVYAIPLLVFVIWSFFMTVLSTELAPFYILGIVALGILTIYVAPSAILSYGFSKKLSESFKLKKVFKKAFNKKYFTAWIIGVLLYIAVALVFGGIAGIGNIRIAAYIADAIIGFLGGIIFYTILGEQW